MALNFIQKIKRDPYFLKKLKKINLINFWKKKGSAQVKSAIMLASLNFKNVTKIIAKKSRNHTENFFKFLKIPIKIKSTLKRDFISVKGVNSINSFNYTIPGDISSSLFFLALTILSSNSQITIKNVNINPTRIGSIKILKRMGIKFLFKNKKNIMVRILLTFL